MASGSETAHTHAPTGRIVFSHANGFPLPVYRRLLQALAPDFECAGVTCFGHDPARPVTVGWSYLIDELVEFVHAHPRGDGPLWLVGHSLGGYLSLLAGPRLAAHVAGIVLLDSPPIGGFSAAMIRLGRLTGLDRLLMPLEATLQRRRHWPDAEAAHAHYAAKHVFQRWDPQVLRDYAEHCTVPDGRGQRELLFDRQIEYRIYRALPTARVAAVAATLRAPVAFIGGRQSRELRRIGLGPTRALVGDRLYLTSGGHLFPMEAPDETARLIRVAIAAMAATATADGTSQTSTRRIA